MKRLLTAAAIGALANPSAQRSANAPTQNERNEHVDTFE